MRKKTLILITIVLSSISTHADSLSIYNTNGSATQEIQEVQEDSIDIVSQLTLAVNNINNLITWTSVLIGILAILVALFGYFGYRHIKEDMEKNIVESKKSIEKLNNEIKNRLEELNKKKRELNDYISLTKVISEKIDVQEKYINKTNEYLYMALEKMANQINDKSILDEMLHNLRITNLYSNDDSKVFAALAHLHVKGTSKDIEHLEFCSQHNGVSDSNKLIAREIIGIIKFKNTNML